MFLLLALGVVLLVLAFLLARGSMKDFQDTPDVQTPQGLYLIKNPKALTVELINNLFADKIDPLIISFEFLYKGKSFALAVFGPKKILEKFAQLDLLELEDYSDKLDTNLVSAQEILLQQFDPGKDSLNILKSIHLEEEEYLYTQVVVMPLSSQRFQAQMRLVGSAKHSARRLELIKSALGLLEKNLTLKRAEKKRSSGQVFADFKKRSIYPPAVKKTVLGAQELYSLLKQNY